MNRFLTLLLCALLTFVLVGCSEPDKAENKTTDNSTEGDKTIMQFMDCFKKTPIVGEITSDCWGFETVGKRDTDNGLEDKLIGNSDADGTRYCYWDGAIIKEDGKYYMIASRWDESAGHGGWPASKAILAVSDNLYGPYEDKGLIYPDVYEGYGHNVFPFLLQEGEEFDGKQMKYGLVLGDTFVNELKGGIFLAEKVTGPWNFAGQMQIVAGEGTNGVFSLSNVGIVPTPEGGYIAYNRNGDISVSDSVYGPWTTKVENLWNKLPELSGKWDVEDPVMWYSDGLYHMIANRWDERKAYYMTSKNGIYGWEMRMGAAYTPESDFFTYEDGTVNRWNKIERPNVYMEDGKVIAMTFAAIDVPKDDDKGNDAHGSKIIVVSFDNDALNRFDENKLTIVD